MDLYTVPDGTRIGHVHLTVSDLGRAEEFYSGLLGFDVKQRWGDSAIFLAADDYHHHLGINTWAGRGAPPPPPGTTGLYHLAILYPSRADLAQVLRRLLDAEYPIDGASDHGVSEALYLRDPDGNGVELYADRDPARWPRNADGSLEMVTRQLDIRSLLAAADAKSEDALSVQELHNALEDLTAWQGDLQALRRSLEFADFTRAVAFVDRVAILAEELDHHPDIDIRYRRVDLSLRSHDAGGVTHRDLELARRIDALASEPGR